MDLDRVFQHLTQEEFVKYNLYNTEKHCKLAFMANSRIFGHQISQIFVISDVKNFGLSNFTSTVRKLTKIQIKILQDFYPEMLGVCLIINTPWAFSSIFAICKGFLDEKTKNRIFIAGSDPYEELCKHIDPEMIPDFFGGGNKTALIEDKGPWSDYEILDGCKKGDQVGVIHKVTKEKFLIEDFEKLPNKLLKDPNSSTRYFEKKSQINRNGAKMEYDNDD